jgi:hypothetical protein
MECIAYPPPFTLLTDLSSNLLKAFQGGGDGNDRKLEDISKELLNHRKERCRLWSQIEIFEDQL